MLSRLGPPTSQDWGRASRPGRKAGLSPSRRAIAAGRFILMDKTIELTERGNFRFKVRAIVAGLEGHGYKPLVHNALRTVEQQKALVAKGHSRTMRSKHLPGPDGLARACDVVDQRYAWGAPKHVWVMIGRLALTQGCEWGGLWGLPRSVRRKFEDFLFDRSKPFDAKAWKGPIGWDPAHIEAK